MQGCDWLYYDYMGDYKYECLFSAFRIFSNDDTNPHANLKRCS